MYTVFPGKYIYDSNRNTRWSSVDLQILIAGWFLFLTLIAQSSFIRILQVLLQISDVDPRASHAPDIKIPQYRPKKWIDTILNES